jgi:DNA-binding CsgD family transcriptional regulator
VLCSQRTPTDARCIVGGTAVGGALYFLLAWLPSWVVAAISMLVIAPGTSALLVACAFRLVPGEGGATGGATDDGDSREADEPAPRRVTEFFGGVVSFPSERAEHRGNLRKGVLALIAPCLTIGAIGFVMQVVRLGLSMATPSSEELVGNLNSLALVASSGITWMLFERDGYHLDMGVFYRVAAPGIGLACALLPYLGVGYGYALSFALYTTFSIASMMGILACNQVSRHYRVSPVAMYALSFGIIYSMRYLPAIPFNALANSGVDLQGTAFATLPSSLASVLVMFAAYVFSDRFQTKQDTTRVYSWESELVSPADEPSDTPRDTPQEPSLGPIARAHGLTERECEVLGMLRSGRSVPAIAEHLGVSPNTVRFHCKNVYAKLGVHSKQELIDLVDCERQEGR